MTWEVARSCGAGTCISDDGVAWTADASEVVGESGLWSIAFAPGLE